MESKVLEPPLTQLECISRTNISLSLSLSLSLSFSLRFVLSSSVWRYISITKRRRDQLVGMLAGCFARDRPPLPPPSPLPIDVSDSIEIRDPLFRVYTVSKGF